jgi:hypothetical protein
MRRSAVIDRYERVRWAVGQLLRPGGHLRDPAFGRRVGDMVRTANARWRILDIQYLGDSITHRPKVEYLVRPIRLFKRLPAVWVPAERFLRK